ncbi:virulence factor Mce family protein [Actinomadura craniellae]|uniref:Virulence factor Mce family protein n=1 Tax=Actinomadura craniellae TaxID=2231787 RepID=A0A365H7X1_9ACTN|nr:MCE family protein [Actinomadura craniellae]RAY15171.1 virulence factor Mce family protein [Actinomadura craniellae]
MTHAAVTSSGLAEKTRFRIAGLAFILVVLLLVALTVALFQKVFVPVVRAEVRADRAGLQLLPRSDVKVRGLIVGEVRGTRATANGAVLDLAIDPDKAELIPTNVQARLLPKTLFGEKYVDLMVPPQPAALGLRNGAVIQQDRSQAAVEIDRVLNNLLPLLQAVRPEQLNATLNALATALQGRGDQLGHNLEQADALLKKLNPKVPTLLYDLRALADVSDIYTAAAPDLMQALRNLNVTNRTIVDRRATIEDLIPGVTRTARNGDRFVQNNGNKIIGFNIANKEGLALLARYSPSLPCVFEGLAKLAPRAIEAGGGNGSTFNVTIEIVKPRPAYKNPLELPEARDHRNPRCYGLPNPQVPFPDYLALDGTEDNLWWRDPDPPNEQPRGRAAAGVFVDPGDMPEQEKIKNVVGPMIHTPADQVSDVATLLFGPLMQGSVVTIE